MKFKKILENKEEQTAARYLDDQLKLEYKNENKNLLYRKDETLIDTWKERDIRKDRKPLDTDTLVNKIVKCLEVKKFSNVPKRSKSKFAVSEGGKENLSLYSGYTYICFPHEDADVVSLNKDSYTKYFEKAYKHLRSAKERYDEDSGRFELKREEVPEVIIKFMDQLLDDWRYDKSFVETRNFICKNYDEIVNKTADASSNSYEFHATPKLLNDLVTAFSKIESYFRDMEAGIKKGSEEVIFDGPSYILVHPDFFDEYFKWMDGMWQLKRIYQRR